MQPCAPAADDVAFPLGLACIEEPGEINQWHAKLTPVRKLYPHIIGIKRYFSGPWFKC